MQTNILYGDAFAMYDNARGGDDTLIGGDHRRCASDQSTSIGDAYSMSGNARGGNDTLTGGASAINYLMATPTPCHDNARGGNDTLIGGDRWSTTTTSTATPTPCTTTPAAATTR